MSIVQSIVTFHAVIALLGLTVGLLTLYSWSRAWRRATRLNVLASSHPLVPGVRYAQRAPRGIDALGVVLMGVVPFLSLVFLAVIMAAVLVNGAERLWNTFKESRVGQHLYKPMC